MADKPRTFRFPSVSVADITDCATSPFSCDTVYSCTSIYNKYVCYVNDRIIYNMLACSTRSSGKRWTAEKRGTVSLSQVCNSIIIIVLSNDCCLLLLISLQKNCKINYINLIS